MSLYVPLVLFFLLSFSDTLTCHSQPRKRPLFLLWPHLSRETIPPCIQLLYSIAFPCLHLFWQGNVIWHSWLSFLKLQLPFAPAGRWTFSFSYPFILFPFTGFLTLPTARWSPIMPTLLSSSAILSNLNVLSSLSFCIALTSPRKAPKSPSLHFYTPAPDAQFLFYVIRPYMYRDVISNSTYPEPDTSSFWDE